MSDSSPIEGGLESFFPVGRRFTITLQVTDSALATKLLNAIQPNAEQRIQPVEGCEVVAVGLRDYTQDTQAFAAELAALLGKHRDTLNLF